MKYAQITFNLYEIHTLQRMIVFYENNTCGETEETVRLFNKLFEGGARIYEKSDKEGEKK